MKLKFKDKRVKDSATYNAATSNDARAMHT